MERIKPQEGDIYSVVNVGGHSFTIRYGYYSETERGVTEPIPIYPCFLTEPHYTEEGYPLVTRIQDPCEYYEAVDGDGWCADCIHCSSVRDEIGICRCDKKQKQNFLNPETCFPKEVAI